MKILNTWKIKKLICQLLDRHLLIRDRRDIFDYAMMPDFVVESNLSREILRLASEINMSSNQINDLIAKCKQQNHKGRK